MYEKYLEKLEEAGKIRNLKERSINRGIRLISVNKIERIEDHGLLVLGRGVVFKRQKIFMGVKRRIFP